MGWPSTPQEWGTILLSVLGFGAWVLVDLPPLVRHPHWVRGVNVVSALVLAGVLVKVTLGRTRWIWPLGVRLLGGILLCLGLVLLVYSVVLEIPWRQRRQAAGAGNGLIQEGTYALCRHPGALWMGLFLIGWVLAFPGPEVVRLSVVWFLLELLVVWVQDRWTLPRRFVGYAQYRHTTPFLIPTRASMKAAWATWRRQP